MASGVGSLNHHSASRRTGSAPRPTDAPMKSLGLAPLPSHLWRWRGYGQTVERTPGGVDEKPETVICHLLAVPEKPPGPRSVWS